MNSCKGLALLAVLSLAVAAARADEPGKQLQALMQRAATKEGRTEALRQELLAFIRQHPGTPAHQKAAAALTALPSPLDRLDTARIPDEQRKLLDLPALVALVRPHNRAVASLAFSPDGTRLASSSWDNSVVLLNVAQAEPNVADTLDGSPSGVAFSPDGKLLAAGNPDGNVLLWDVTGAKPARKFTLAGHRQRPIAVEFSPTGQMFASGSFRPVLRLWKLDDVEPEAWAALANEEDAPAVGVSALAFRGDGKLLAAGSLLGKHTLRFWDAAGSYLEEKFFHPAKARVVRFAPAQPLLAFVGDDATIHLWRIDGERAEKLLVLKGHAARPFPPAVKALAFNPAGTRLASAGPDRKVILWDTATGKQERSWSLVDEPRALAFAPDGRHLAVGCDDGSIFVLRLSE